MEPSSSSAPSFSLYEQQLLRDIQGTPINLPHAKKIDKYIYDNQFTISETMSQTKQSSTIQKGPNIPYTLFIPYDPDNPKTVRVIVLCKKKRSVYSSPSESLTQKIGEPLFSTAESVGKFAFEWITKTPLVEIKIGIENSATNHLDVVNARYRIKEAMKNLKDKPCIAKSLNFQRTIFNRDEQKHTVFFFQHLYHHNFWEELYSKNLPKTFIEGFSKVYNLAQIADDLSAGRVIHSQCRPEHTLVDAHGNLFLTDFKKANGLFPNDKPKVSIYLAPEVVLQKPLQKCFNQDMWGLGMQALQFLLRQNDQTRLGEQLQINLLNKILGKKETIEINDFQEVLNPIFRQLELLIYFNDELTFEECTFYQTLLRIVEEMVQPDVELRISAPELMEKLKKLAKSYNHPLFNKAMELGIMFPTIKRIDDYVKANIDIWRAHLDSRARKAHFPTQKVDKAIPSYKRGLRRTQW